MSNGWLGLVLFVALTTACATSPKLATDAYPVPPEEPVEAPPPPARQTTIKSLEFEEVPEEYSYHVTNWLNYFQGRGRKHMLGYLERSTRYLPMMKDVFKSNGLPEELAYLALIESGFSFKARSRAGAVGYWQFMRGTARSYGLAVNSLVDERRDPVLSTEAAVRYLKGLYSVFGSWSLAIASYNVGENRVKRVVMKNYTRDFWELVRRRQLPAETMAYVPKFIAARMIARDPEKFGFENLNYEPPLMWEEIRVERSVDLRRLARDIGVDYQEIRRLNPAYRSYIAHAKKGSMVLRVPQATKDKAQQVVAKSFIKVGNIRVQEFKYYRVGRSERLPSIAQKFGTTVAAIQSMNRLRGTALKSGRLLKIPLDGEADISPVVARKSKATRSVASKRKNFDSRTHVVRRGETLSHIAKRYRVPLGRLVATNGISRGSQLHVGKVLQIP